MNLFQTQYSINCQGNLVDLSIPKVMGIVNLAPDSFYEKSRIRKTSQIVASVDEMVDQGADIIDIGAYSSRPGAEHISEELEWERLKGAFDAIREKYSDILISVDTFRSNIAQKCVNQYNVNIINDISGGELDNEMFATVGELKVPYILMHMQGTPQTMQDNPSYTHIIQEILTFFAIKKEQLLNAGAHDIIIDPGFGFGKTLDHNFQIMNRLNEFGILESPLLVGVSRKSMIYKYFNFTPNEALNGTTVLNTLALTKGASVLRVHDVKEAVEVVKLFAKVQNQ